jgi:hypothetical protein
MSKNKNKPTGPTATNAEALDIQKSSGEFAKMLQGVELEGSLAERAHQVGELIEGILKGEVKANLDVANSADVSLPTPIVRSSLVGVSSAVPAAFTVAQLQSIFGSQATPSSANQQIARHTAIVPLFRGLLGPMDAIVPTTTAIKTVVTSELEIVYAQRSRYKEARGRVAVRHDLRMHRAYDPDARCMSAEGSVWDKLSAVGFNQTQFLRLMNSLAYLREGFSLQRGNDGLIEPDQKGNWLHTMDELDAALDRTRGDSVADRERALMGMFGDAWKTKFNFTRHNYDGADVARIVLSRQLDADFTSTDLHGIIEANKEHQVSPPGLMGILYTNKIAGVLNAQRGQAWGMLIDVSKNGELSPTQQRELAFWTEIAMEQDYRQFQLAMLREQGQINTLTPEELEAMKRLQDRTRFGSFVTDEDYKTLSSLQSKISDPYAHELERTASGGMAVKLTDQEREQLKLSGIDHWHIPHESTPWYWISRTGVVADILANLGLGGRCKLTRLNGPETDPVFQFGTIRQCVESGLKTYADIGKILSEEEHEHVRSRLGTMNSAIDRAMERLKQWLRKELSLQEKTEPQNVPFWDVPLKYPHRGLEEANWWNVNRIPEAQRSAEQRLFWEQHRFDGLTATDKQHYVRAIRIRDRAVEELGKELRLDNRYVPDFTPVMTRR